MNSEEREILDLAAQDPKFHEYLIKSQAVRLTGDYNHTENVTEDSANQILLWAGEFLAAAKDFLK